MEKNNKIQDTFEEFIDLTEIEQSNAELNSNLAATSDDLSSQPTLIFKNKTIFNTTSDRASELLKISQPDNRREDEDFSKSLFNSKYKDSFDTGTNIQSEYSKCRKDTLPSNYIQTPLVNLSPPETLSVITVEIQQQNSSDLLDGENPFPNLEKNGNLMLDIDAIYDQRQSSISNSGINTNEKISNEGKNQGNYAPDELSLKNLGINTPTNTKKDDESRTKRPNTLPSVTEVLGSNYRKLRLTYSDTSQPSLLEKNGHIQHIENQRNYFHPPIHTIKSSFPTQKSYPSNNTPEALKNPHLLNTNQSKQPTTNTNKIQSKAPLADRYRPKSFEDLVGHTTLIGNVGTLRKLIEVDKLPSIILWGPPGCGKTSIANIIALHTNRRFYKQSAALSGVSDIKKIINEALNIVKHQPSPILFLDEIHRFNKAQQDSLLPHVENGTVILIGATTENPSFEVNSALLSRCRTFKLEQLQQTDIKQLLKQVSHHEQLDIDDETTDMIAGVVDGDGRTALNLLEMAMNLCNITSNFGVHTPVSSPRQITVNDIKHLISNKSHLLYDRKGDAHYDLISALHKSVRGSDKDASCYYLARMLEAGEDPLYVARRLIRMSTEDIGLADPYALTLCVSAYQASHFIGMPECTTALCMAVCYMCNCPKSNAIEVAYENAKRCVKDTYNEGPPLHIRNAPTKLMRDMSYGAKYVYTNQPHIHTPAQQKGVYGVQTYLPNKLLNTTIFPPM